MTLLQAIKKHSITRNATALAIMQVANYAVPLLLLPYLTRQLGLEAFGIVAITLAAIQLAFVLTDYGFSLSATYAISLNRENDDFINKKIGSIFGAKILLLSLLAIISASIITLIPNADTYEPFYWAALAAIAAQAFQPIWLFQGIECMKNIAIYTVLSKITYAALILLTVSQPKDAISVIYCWSLSQLSGLAASIYFMYAGGYKISLPSLHSIKQEFQEGAQFFWSRLAVALYTSASTLIIGSYSTVQAAHFAVCEQIYKAGQNVTSPINSAMYPYMAKSKDWSTFYRILSVSTVVLIIGCLVLSKFVEPLLLLLFGVEYTTAAPVLLLFLCTTVINYLSVTFGYSAFSALDRVEIANLTVIAGALIHGLNMAIIYTYFEISAFSVALAVLLTESFVMLTRILIFNTIKNNCKE